MNTLKKIKMDDHSLIMGIAALVSAFGLKEIWAIIKKKIDIEAQKDEREEEVYTNQIQALTDKISGLEIKIQKLIEENTQLLVKVARMEEKLILNAKKRVKSKIKNDERN
tara:strand:+ start:3319 stop:3648 length:330 start_codon:yes stop_codon:yes gene_type:complete